MDPLSITASVTALIGAAQMIAQAVQSIRDAPRLICTVSSETKVLASIFSQLNSSFFQASKMADDTMRQFRELLDRMQALFSELEQALAGIAVGRLRLLDRVVWAGREDEVKHILADLLQQKASLNIMISIATGKQKTQASEPPPPVQWLSLNLSRRRPASNSTFLLERSLLPLSSVRLARLVRNPKDPCQDFIDPPVPPSASDIIMEHHKDISETQRSAKTSSLRARFASRVSVSAEFREASVAVIKAKDARSYQLPNSSNWFRKAKENAEVCRWMEEGGGGEVYFVEGFRTVIETHLREAKTFGSCSAQDGEIGEALAQAGNERDLVGGVEETQADSHERSLYAAEETIYAIQYRRVERGWLSKNAKSATLDPNSRWEIMWGHMR